MARTAHCLIYGVTTCQATAFRYACPLGGELLWHDAGHQLRLLLASPTDGYLDTPAVDRALAFDKTLRDIHQSIDFLPMRYTGLRDIALIMAWVKTANHQLVSELERLQGTSQFNVRWLDIDSAHTQDRSRYAISGKDYLRHRYQINRDEQASMQALAEVLRRRIDVRDVLPATVRILDSGHTLSRRTLIGLDCLVERRGAEFMAGHLRTLQHDQRQPDLVTGPLPPLSFVRLSSPIVSTLAG